MRKLIAALFLLLFVLAFLLPTRPGQLPPQATPTPDYYYGQATPRPDWTGILRGIVTLTPVVRMR